MFTYLEDRDIIVIFPSHTLSLFDPYQTTLLSLSQTARQSWMALSYKLQIFCGRWACVCERERERTNGKVHNTFQKYLVGKD